MADILFMVGVLYLLSTEVVSDALLTGMNSQDTQRMRIEHFIYAKFIFTCSHVRLPRFIYPPCNLTDFAQFV